MGRPQCQDNVTGCGIMSSVRGMIHQWGSTIKVSCNNVARTDFGRWSELQHGAILATTIMMQYKNSDWRQNSYQNQKRLQESNISCVAKCFWSVFQKSNHIKLNHCPKMHIFRVWYVFMHLLGAVLVFCVSVVTRQVWSKVLTMKSTQIDIISH